MNWILHHLLSLSAIEIPWRPFKNRHSRVLRHLPNRHVNTSARSAHASSDRALRLPGTATLRGNILLWLCQVLPGTNCLTNVTRGFLVVVFKVFICDECYSSELAWSRVKDSGREHHIDPGSLCFSGAGNDLRTALGLGWVVIIDVLQILFELLLDSRDASLFVLQRPPVWQFLTRHDHLHSQRRHSGLLFSASNRTDK